MAGSLAEWWWIGVPIRLRERLPLLSAIWADGFYLLAWPALAWLLPLGALVLGGGAGVTHWGNTLGPQPIVSFVQLVPLLYIAAIVGAFSAQLGLFLVIGYAVGDWFFTGSLDGPTLLSFEHFLRLGVPKLLTYALFLMLTVQPTLASRVLAASILRLRRLPAGAAFWTVALLSVPLHGFMVWAWTMVAPMAIRPLWLWASPSATPILTVPFFTSIVDPALPLVAAAAVLARSSLAWNAQESTLRQARTLTSVPASRTPRRTPAWITVILTAFALTLSLCGFFRGFLVAGEVFAVLLAIMAFRYLIVPKLPLWTLYTQTLGRVPLLVRWIATVCAAYLLTRSVFLSRYADVGNNSIPGQFWPDLISIVAGIAVATLLLPHPPPEPEPKPS